MAANTTTYSFLKPTVGGDTDLWGGYLNTNFDDIDDLLDGTSPIAGVDINGGTIDGTSIGLTAASTGAFTTLTIGGVLLTATATELNLLDGATFTLTEANYLSGVTSAIQGQLDAKIDDADAPTGDIVGTTDTQTLTNKTLTGVILDGVPTAPTASVGTDTTQVATTAFVQANGKVRQTVYTQTGAVATGTGVIPSDNTIPQITEGTEYMTLAITPTSATSILKIEVAAYGSFNNNRIMTVALFQDATADALAVVGHMTASTDAPGVVNLRHTMVAGTTSATTFRVRIGSDSSATFTFNGVSGSRRYGGVSASSITITELTP